MGYEAKFPKGSRVKIADRATLEEFIRTWTLHHPLEKRQLRCAGQKAKISEIYFYHGGDVLYKLRWRPGIWHEQLLEPVK